MSRTPLVVGNWKMNGSLGAVASWAASFRALCEEAAPGCETGLCVPSVYVQPLAALFCGEQALPGFRPGAETVSDREEPGAFTGEVSAAMLRDAGACWCIVGHSERRTLFGETDEVVARKVAAAHAAGLRPILCVGETLEEREAGKTRRTVLRQLDAVLGAAGISALAGGAVAYEPLWAIGTGKAAGAEDIKPVHAVIRSALTQADRTIGEGIRILYGGSVKPANAAGILSLPNVDGALVGGASLDAGNFYRICTAR